MDPELQSLLRSIDQGNLEDIPKLEEWLKTHGDSRAELARQAATLDPQEIAEELVKIRSLRPSNDSMVNLLAQLASVLAIGAPDLLSPDFSISHVESSPMTPRWWPPSAMKCKDDVEEALATKRLPADIARAVRNARKLKIDRLLAAFQPATPPSPPAPD